MTLPWTVELAKQGYEAGYARAREELAPLIEAARAYRDALAAVSADKSGENWSQWSQSVTALKEAARVIDVSYVGDDETA